MKITKGKLRRLIREVMEEPPERSRPDWMDSHYTELGRRKKMVSQWKDEGIQDAVDFETWMAEIVGEAQANTQPSSDMSDFHSADPHDEETWASLMTDLEGYGKPETNYYSEWYQAKGSLSRAKALGLTIAQHMNSDAAEAVLGYYDRGR